MSVLTFLTVSTSVMGAVELTDSLKIGSNNESVLGVDVKKGKLDESKEDKTESTVFKSRSEPKGITGTKTPPVLSVAPQSRVAISQMPSTVIPAAEQAVLPTFAVNANSCIITVFGQQYDVNRLRSTHPGGDVFACGTDQSASYQRAHGSNVSRIAGYLISNTGSIAGNQTVNSAQVNNSTTLSLRKDREEEDDDQDEVEEEYHEQEDAEDE